jgi:hypothetical protein
MRFLALTISGFVIVGWMLMRFVAGKEQRTELRESTDQSVDLRHKLALLLLLLFLGLYLIVCGLLAAYALIDAWSSSFRLWMWIFPNLDLTSDSHGFLKTFSYMVAGSVIGAVIRSFQGLHQYGAVQGTFRASYTVSYLVGPWTAALLGVAVYGLVRGGVLVFGGAEEIERPNEATQLGYLGLGTIVGFAWDKVLVKLSSLADQFLGMEGSSFPRTKGIKPQEVPDAGEDKTQG